VVTVRSFLLDVGGQLAQIAAGDREVLERARTTARIISASAALRARERQAIADIAGDLAAVLGDDPVTRAMANALMGVHSALVDYARNRLLANDRPGAIAADLRTYGERAFALLERGLKDFARGAELV
jgi:hypothetical protein